MLCDGFIYCKKFVERLLHLEVVVNILCKRSYLFDS